MIIVATNDLIARELRKFLILSQRHSLLRYSQIGNTFTITVTWPQVLADRWRAYVLGRWGV